MDVRIFYFNFITRIEIYEVVEFRPVRFYQIRFIHARKVKKMAVETPENKKKTKILGYVMRV